MGLGVLDEVKIVLLRVYYDVDVPEAQGMQIYPKLLPNPNFPPLFLRSFTVLDCYRVYVGLYSL